MIIKEGIYNVGVSEKNQQNEKMLFEGQYNVPNGMSYNSYIIKDDKIAVLDTVDKKFKDEWLKNVEQNLDGKTPDYLVVHHMEPDHSSNIVAFLEKYPQTTVVVNKKSQTMLKQFFNEDCVKNFLVVGDGEKLNLGKRELTFVFAPMVHWPEVMVSYDEYDKILFSADAFGAFGTADTPNLWNDEARRYYIGIVGKYGVQVQSLLKKAAALKIEIICPLHGNVLDNDLEKYIKLYDIWSSYTPEQEGVLIAYTSVYGNTKAAALKLAEQLKNAGAKEVKVADLARCDMSEAVALAFKYSKTVFATTTYNGEIFPFMKQFIDALTERNYQNRKVGFIENGSWAPVAAKIMKGMLEKCKNIDYIEQVVTIRSAITLENEKQILEMAKALI